MSKLAVTVITFNEQENLQRCLDSVKKLNPGEIILVDSNSTDQTLQIARQFHCKIFIRKFDNFASQKNFSLDQVKSEWAFSVDADEVISDELSDEIKEAIRSDQFVAYQIPRRNVILGAEIKYSRWSPDKHIWLWKKNFGRWQGEVHEEVQVTGEIGELINPKIHYQDQNISEFIISNKKYAKLMAAKMVKENVKFSIIRLIYDPAFEFIIRFIYKLGFLDGWRGLVLATLMAYYKFDVWMNILTFKKT